uniref:superoxide dismutase n=1 Tax=Quercus lobata TaxID=97700 RepID=A0A7N2KKA0_QUELO
MQLHHQKHHQTYITNYNKALEQLDQALAKADSSSIVQLQSAIKFNGGGHKNHSIFWKNLTPLRVSALAFVISTFVNRIPLISRRANQKGRGQKRVRDFASSD